MPKLPGRLLADLHPNGTVRVVFIAIRGAFKCSDCGGGESFESRDGDKYENAPNPRYLVPFS